MVALEQVPLFPAEKRCCRCLDNKPVDAFGRRAASSDGLHPYCRSCMRAYKRDEYQRHKAGTLTPAQELRARRLKRCRQCGALKPFASFKMSGGRPFHICRECQRQQRRLARQARLGDAFGEPERLWAQGMKRCTLCHEVLPLARFGVQTYARDGLNWWCRACNNGRGKAYYALHRDDKLAYACAYYEANNEAIGTANRARRRARRDDDPAAWHAANQAHYQRYGRRAKDIERVRLWHARHGERVREHRRQSYRRHRERHLLHMHRRRVRLRRIEGRWSSQDIALIYETQRGRCAYCLVPLAQTFHRDHMIPVIRPESSNWPHNLCLCCPRCNRRKHALDAGQFLARLIKERRAERKAQAAT